MYGVRYYTWDGFLVLDGAWRMLNGQPCATELLRKGSSLGEIADFLGHSNLESVSIYAKHDIRSLRKIADFRLVGVR
jgi:integrase